MDSKNEGRQPPPWLAALFTCTARTRGLPGGRVRSRSFPSPFPSGQNRHGHASRWTTQGHEIGGVRRRAVEQWHDSGGGRGQWSARVCQFGLGRPSFRFPQQFRDLGSLEPPSAHAGRPAQPSAQSGAGGDRPRRRPHRSRALNDILRQERGRRWAGLRPANKRERPGTTSRRHPASVKFANRRRQVY